MKSLHWVFFDVGSTLVDEEAAYRHRARDMIRGTAVPLEQYYEKRVQFAKAGFNGDQRAIEYFGLTKTPWHSEDEVPFADCRPENAVMVGDRLDNDVRPVKALGMTSIRMRKGLAVYMRPSCAAEVPDCTVSCLAELPGVLAQLH